MLVQDAQMHLAAEVPRMAEACQSIEAALAALDVMEQRGLHLLVFQAFHLMTVSMPAPSCFASCTSQTSQCVVTVMAGSSQHGHPFRCLRIWLECSGAAHQALQALHS